MSEKKNKGMELQWRTMRLGDIVENVNDFRAPNLKESIPYVAGEHIDEGDLRVRRYGLTSDELVPPTFSRLFKKGDVLFHSRNIKKLAQPDFEGLTGEKLFVLRTKNHEALQQNFLPFLLQSERFANYVQEHWTGSTNKFLNKTPLMAYQFALPPLEKQAKVIDVMAAIDDCLEACRTLKASCSALLQSMLERIWIDFPKKKINDLIADGVIAPPQDGNHGEKHPKVSDYVTEGVPFVMASDLKNGKVDLAECSKIPESLARTLRIGFAKSGDILLSHKGTVGAVARLKDLATNFAMLSPQVTYYRVVDKSKLQPDWLYFAFQTPGFKRLLAQHGQQSTRAYVGITAQRELLIPVAPSIDQAQILGDLIEIEIAIAAAEIRTLNLIEIQRFLLAEALA